MHSLKERKHLAKPRASKRNIKPKIPQPLDAAHALFTAKMVDLAHTSWEETERLEFAISYALDHCGAHGVNLIGIETRLRSELHVKRWTPAVDDAKPPRDVERDTDHARQMAEAYGPGKPLPWGTDEPLIRDAGQIGTAPHNTYCQSGKRCVIGSGGRGAVMSSLQRAATNSNYCIPCTEQRTAAKTKAQAA
jgi:hypothetical protein